MLTFKGYKGVKDQTRHGTSINQKDAGEVDIFEGLKLDIADSVLAKLRNKAKASGISYQQCLQLFFQEEFLRKLAGSKYAENFFLKGGLFIYMLTDFESRATVDVDFLMRGLNNDLIRSDSNG